MLSYTYKSWSNWINLSKELVKILILETHKHRHNLSFMLPRQGDELNYIYTLDENYWVYKTLDENFYDHSLKLWSQRPRFCESKLIDPRVIIGVKSLIYIRQDIKEFDHQLYELLKK